MKTMTVIELIGCASAAAAAKSKKGASKRMRERERKSAQLANAGVVFSEL